MKRVLLALLLFFTISAVAIVTYARVFERTREKYILKAIGQLGDVGSIEQASIIINLKSPSLEIYKTPTVFREGEKLGLDFRKSRGKVLYYRGIYLGSENVNILDETDSYFKILRFSDNSDGINYFFGGGKIGRTPLAVEFYDSNFPGESKFYVDISQKLKAGNKYLLEIPTRDFFKDTEFNLGVEKYPFWLYFKLMINPVVSDEMREKRAQAYLLQYFLLRNNSNLSENLNLAGFDKIGSLIPIVGVISEENGFYDAKE